MEAEAINLVAQFLSAPTLFGAIIALFVGYLWYSKIRNEKSAGSDFREVIDELKGQIGELRDQLKEEREAREEAEKQKFDAFAQVTQLTLEIGQLKQQVTLLQSTIEDMKAKEDTILAQTARS